METKLLEIKAISTTWRRVNVVFWSEKFLPKKTNLTFHIINNVHKDVLKRMGLMGLTKVNCLHCVQWLRILHSHPSCISWLFQYDMQFEQRKSENTITDLQCRSMQDNLIFTNIAEIKYTEVNQYENTEQTLRKFLAEEMGIHKPIEFARVHRLGIYDELTAETSPRPIIAKFERFKDREHVRSLAAETLRGSNFGIREQFPKTIEEKRKVLYPVAKQARKNTENKVRLIRDKLYINDEEVVVESNKTSEKSVPGSKHQQHNNDSNTSGQNPWQSGKLDRTSYRGERVFYRGRGARGGFGARNSVPKTVDFSIPMSNKYEPLAQLDQTPVRQDSGNITGTGSSKKHPASSPLDDENMIKRHRDDLVIHVSDANDSEPDDSGSDDPNMAVSPCPDSPEKTQTDPKTNSEPVTQPIPDSESHIQSGENVSDVTVTALAALLASSLKDGDERQADANANQPATDNSENVPSGATSETA